MDVIVCRKREVLRIWKQSWKEDREKYWETKKDAERVVYMAMGQKAREHGEDDLCQTKSWGEERMLWGDESEAVKVTVDD